MDKIRNILNKKRGEITERILKNTDDDEDKSKRINIATEIKNKNQWLVEFVSKFDETISEHYIEVLKDIDKHKEKLIKKRVVVVNPDGVEEIYPTIYRASKELEIHPSIISFCCKGERNLKSGKSKKDGKIYSFHYEGESGNDTGKLKYNKPTNADRVLEVYNKN